MRRSVYKFPSPNSIAALCSRNFSALKSYEGDEGRQREGDRGSETEGGRQREGDSGRETEGGRQREGDRG